MSTQKVPGHKSGFVSIIGSPNVGKSTLINALVQYNLAIATHKAQTTRHRILGFVNAHKYQIVFSDTPGIVKAHYKLHENMNDMVLNSFIDADILLYVIDPGEKEIKNPDIEKKVLNLEIPVILVVNKADTLTEEKVEELRIYWKEKLPKADIRFISALHKVHTTKLIELIVEKLPEGEAFYPKDQITNKSERFIVSEIVRKHIFLQFKQEIPYVSEVQVELFKEQEKIIHIHAMIYVERDSQKHILIGKKGAGIKQLGIDSRKEIEGQFKKQVMLQLSVKVLKNWRGSDMQLKRFGY